MEDYWGSSTHRGYSPWSPVGAPPHDTTIPFGSIGQEIYGAGAAFDGALLAPLYITAAAASAPRSRLLSRSSGSDSVSARNKVEGAVSNVAASVQQIHPPFLAVAPGGLADFSVHPPFTAAEWASAMVEIETGKDGVGLGVSLEYDNNTGVCSVHFVCEKVLAFAALITSSIST